LKFFTVIAIIATLYINTIININREIIKPTVNCIGIQISGISIIENMIENIGCFLLILKYRASIAIAMPLKNIIPNTISKNVIVFPITNSPIKYYNTEFPYHLSQNLLSRTSSILVISTVSKRAARQNFA
jgi:hypothetical protein